MKLRILSAKDIDRAITMAEAIEANAQAFMALSSGQALSPLRMHLDSPGGTTLVKPAYLQDSGALACKVVTVFPENPAQGIPTVQALVLAFDGETGTPTALLEGSRLTALRTGAASGAATRLLARQDSKALALFGAGGNGPDQAEAVIAARGIQEVRIFDLNPDLAAKAAADIMAKHEGIKAFAAASSGAAVRGADVICCATTSKKPVFDPADVSPGTHINGIGSFTPEMREVQVKGLKNLHIFVDTLESALAEAGDIMQALAEGLIEESDLTELGTALNGDAPGRESENEITFFKSVGTAAQDVATAHAIMQKAEKLKLGALAEM